MRLDGIAATCTPKYNGCSLRSWIASHESPTRAVSDHSAVTTSLEPAGFVRGFSLAGSGADQQELADTILPMRLGGSARLGSRRG